MQPAERDYAKHLYFQSSFLYCTWCLLVGTSSIRCLSPQWLAWALANPFSSIYAVWISSPPRCALVSACPQRSTSASLPVQTMWFVEPVNPTDDTGQCFIKSSVLLQRISLSDFTNQPRLQCCEVCWKTNGMTVQSRNMDITGLVHLLRSLY